MPILRIVHPGFEGYNGPIQGVQFRDGKSLEEIPRIQAESIGAFMRVVDDATDEVLSVGQRMVNMRTSGSEVRQDMERIKRTPTGKKKESIKKDAKTVSYDFTRESLEQVADKGGIQDLRKVADQYDVRGRSIAEIIDSLMALKANADAKVAAEAKVGESKPAAAPEPDGIDALIED